jgi:hypothetical protein
MVSDFFTTDERKVSDIFSKDNGFSSESTMIEYIESHKEEFAELIFPGCKLISFEREKHILTKVKMVMKDIPNVRIDIAMLLQRENSLSWWYIEVKNPTSDRNKLRDAISQCMEYKMLAGEGVEVVLLSSVYNEIVPRLIVEYKLPINFCFLNRYYYGMYKHDNNSDWSMPCRK